MKADLVPPARSGSKHLGFLLEKRLIQSSPSIVLRLAYEEAAIERSLKEIEDQVKGKASPDATVEDGGEEKMLFLKSGGAVIAEHLEMPEVQMEIDRAVWQVERAIKTQQHKQGMDKRGSVKEKPEKQE